MRSACTSAICAARSVLKRVGLPKASSFRLETTSGRNFARFLGKTTTPQKSFLAAQCNRSSMNGRCTRATWREILSLPKPTAGRLAIARDVGQGTGPSRWHPPAGPPRIRLTVPAATYPAQKRQNRTSGFSESRRRGTEIMTYCFADAVGGADSVVFAGLATFDFDAGFFIGVVGLAICASAA